MKQIIKERLENGDSVKPLDLRRLFMKEGMVVPTHVQLSNAVQVIKKDLGYHRPFTYAEVIEAVEVGSLDDNKACIMDFKYDLDT
uniref:Uncharacterized protein n=1 Tax=Panagrolaimus sp. JU765 TaxID=591449 RepID=A0AC34Q250_9BILA